MTGKDSVVLLQEIGRMQHFPRLLLQIFNLFSPIPLKCFSDWPSFPSLCYIPQFLQANQTVIYFGLADLWYFYFVC